MFIVFQLLMLVVVVELFVVLMPTSLRRVSKQNRFRLDGTLSDSRSYRERRALNRLRLDLVAVFVLVFLTGNALYYTIDSQFMPGSNLYHFMFNFGSDVPTNLDKQSAEQWEAHSSSIMLLTSLWCLMSCGIIAAGVFRAYRAFSVGVHERSAENFHLDMTRMSISGSEFANEVLANQLGNGRSVAG